MTRFRTYCSRADQLSLAAMAQAPTPGVPGSAEQAAVPSAVPRDAEKLAEKDFNREVKPEIAEPTPGEIAATKAWKRLARTLSVAEEARRRLRCAKDKEQSLGFAAGQVRATEALHLLSAPHGAAEAARAYDYVFRCPATGRSGSAMWKAMAVSLRSNLILHCQCQEGTEEFVYIEAALLKIYGENRFRAKSGPDKDLRSQLLKAYEHVSPQTRKHRRRVRKPRPRWPKSAPRRMASSSSENAGKATRSFVGAMRESGGVLKAEIDKQSSLRAQARARSSSSTGSDPTSWRFSSPASGSVTRLRASLVSRASSRAATKVSPVGTEELQMQVKRLEKENRELQIQVERNQVYCDWLEEEIARGSS